MAKNKDIQYGNIDIPENAFNPENTKVRISMMLRGDILQHFKERADKEGVGYQVLIQQTLAKSMNSDQSLEKRLEKIEEAVFEKKGA